MLTKCACAAGRMHCGFPALGLWKENVLSYLERLHELIKPGRAFWIVP